MAFHVPNSKDADYFPLMVLNSVLSDGKSSRLKKALIYDDEVATEVFSYMPLSIDPNLFYISAVAKSGVSSQQLETAMIKQINQIMVNGITELELQKVKNQSLVDFYRTMSTIDGKANTIGSYEFYFGDYKALFDVPNRLNKVSIEDVKRVAKQYLRKANRTTGVLAAEEDSNENDL